MAARGVDVSSPPNYKLEHKLGKGGFGTVYKALNQLTGQVCALKMIDIGEMSPIMKEESRNEWKKESDILIKVKHPTKIVEFRQSFDTGDKLWLEMEFCSGGDLQSYYAKSRISRPLKHQFLKEISSAVAYLHEKSVMHRDLKPQNILITERSGTPRAKISDFGLAKVIASSRFAGSMSKYYVNAEVGTTYYMAPEVFTKKYTYKADIFSMGLVFIALVTESKTNHDMLACYIQDNRGKIWGCGDYMSREKCNLVFNQTLKIGSNMFKLLQIMIEFNHATRPTANEVNQSLEKSISTGEFDVNSTSRPFSVMPAPKSR